MRTLRLLLCLLLLPAAAQATFVVGPGAPPRLRTLRMLVTLLGRDTALIVEPGWDGGPVEGPVGLVIPLPAGGVWDEAPWNDLSMQLDELDRATQATILRPAPGGCEAAPMRPIADRPVPRPGVDGEVQYQRAATLEALVEWAASSAFVVPARLEAVAEAWLAEGSDLLLVTLRSQAPASSRAVSLTWPGPPRLPLSAVAVTGADPFRLTVFASAGAPVRLDGWTTVTLPSLDRPGLEQAADLTAAIAQETQVRGEPLFVITYARPTRDLDVWGVALGDQERFTRLDAAMTPSMMATDPLLVEDPSLPDVSPVLDLRPDPKAHGASLVGDGPWPILAALLLGLFFRRRRSSSRSA